MKKTFLLSLMAAGMLIGFNADSISLGNKHCFVHENKIAVVPAYMACPKPTHKSNGTVVSETFDDDHPNLPDCFWHFFEEDGR